MSYSFKFGDSDSIYGAGLLQYRTDSQRTLKGYYFRKHPLAKKLKEWITFISVMVVVAPIIAVQAHA